MNQYTLEIKLKESAPVNISEESTGKIIDFISYNLNGNTVTGAISSNYLDLVAEIIASRNLFSLNLNNDKTIMSLRKSDVEYIKIVFE